MTDDGKGLFFTDLPDSKDFIKTILAAFEVVDMQITDTEDFWREDEIAIKATSDVGEFTIVRNDAGHYSILGDVEEDINTLDVILAESGNFTKLV